MICISSCEDTLRHGALAKLAQLAERESAERQARIAAESALRTEKEARKTGEDRERALQGQISRQLRKAVGLK